jgi:hypothetical protein
MRTLREKVPRSSRHRSIWRSTTASFAFAVTHIVTLRPEKQMLVAYAWRPVAVVQDAQTFGNLTMRQLPRYPVGVMYPAAKPKVTISVFVD